MTNGSEHIPEYPSLVVLDETPRPRLTRDDIERLLAGARRIIIDGVECEVQKVEVQEPGVAIRIVPVREGARRLAEYEVVQ